jgi:hypothetical protein
MQRGLQGAGEISSLGVGRQRRRFTLDRMLYWRVPGPACEGMQTREQVRGLLIKEHAKSRALSWGVCWDVFTGLHKELFVYEVGQVAHGDQEALIGVLRILRIPSGGHEEARLWQQIQQGVLHALPKRLIGGVLDRLCGPEGREEMELPDQKAVESGVVRGGDCADRLLDIRRRCVRGEAKEEVECRII